MKFIFKASIVLFASWFAVGAPSNLRELTGEHIKNGSTKISMGNTSGTVAVLTTGGVVAQGNGGTGISAATVGFAFWYNNSGTNTLTSSGTFPVAQNYQLLLAGPINGGINNSTILVNPNGSGSAGQVLASNGSGVVPVWAATLATSVLGNVPSSSLNGTISMVVAGVMPESAGGSGQSSWGSLALLVTAPGNVFGTLGNGSANQVLQSAGNALPTWASTIALSVMPNYPSGNLNGTVSAAVAGVIPESAGGTGTNSWGSMAILATAPGNVFATLGVGSSGQFLQSNGAGSYPTWTTVASAPTNTYWNGTLQPANSGAAWAATTTTATLAVLVLSSGTSQLAVRQSNGLTVTKPGGTCGITFTPASSSSVYWIYTSFLVDIGKQQTGGLKLLDNNGVAVAQTAVDGPIDSTGDLTYSLAGIYVPGTSSAVTLQIQGGIAGTTGINIGYGAAQNALLSGIEWQIFQIK